MPKAIFSRFELGEPGQGGGKNKLEEPRDMAEELPEK